MGRTDRGAPCALHGRYHRDGVEDIAADEWSHPYPRERAGFPSHATRVHKVWPTVGRIDSAYGDRNLVCTCVGMEAY